MQDEQLRRERWGQWIRTAKNQRPELEEVSPTALSKLLGVADTTASTWLKGANVPNKPQQFEAISRVFKRSPREILEAAGYPVDDDRLEGGVRLSPEARELVDTYEQLPPAARAMLLQHIRGLLVLVERLG